MACITLFATSATMATTQFARVVCCESAALRQFEPRTDNQPLRMNWVVVTGQDGIKQLRMQWASSADHS
jgi:hypothetical protein